MLSRDLQLALAHPIEPLLIDDVVADPARHLREYSILAVNMTHLSAIETALGEIAEQLEVTPRNVTGLIDHLERDGLVERIDDPQDRRLTYARLTPAGGKRLEGMRGQGLQWQMKIASGLSIEELEQLRHSCLKLIENMTGARVAVGRSA